jgi:hypothetical protein
MKYVGLIFLISLVFKLCQKQENYIVDVFHYTSAFILSICIFIESIKEIIETRKKNNKNKIKHKKSISLKRYDA